jgi:solute carrier family 25 (mitochondrial carnitine/acylcarnitine transporter), member 20/29
MEGNNKKNMIYSYIDAYSVGLVYINSFLVISHPCERLKIAAQIHLNKSMYNAVRPLCSSFSKLYTGFLPCLYRQNIKLVYRSFLLSEIIPRIDDLNINFILSTCLKALMASSVDTMFITPAENIKTIQMKENERKSVRNAISDIYRTRGCYGFLYGMQPTIIKGFPTWFNLFFGYHMTKNKRQQGYISAILCAVVVSIPMSIVTNPLDVTKTQMQAATIKQSDNIITVGKNLVKNYGVFSLFRGLPFRLIHKSLSAATSYLIMDVGYRSNI